MTNLCPFTVYIYTRYVQEKKFARPSGLSEYRASEKSLRLRMFNSMRKRDNERRSVRKYMLKECEVRPKKGSQPRLDVY